MSLDNAGQGDVIDTVEGPTPAADAPGRGKSSLWFLVVPIALVLAAAALAFFLLSPRDEELMTTTDSRAVAVAVANAKPAEPAFEPAPAQPTEAAPAPSTAP